MLVVHRDLTLGLTTSVPLGRTAATRPVRVVLKDVCDVACAFPESTCVEFGEKRLATPVVFSCPGNAVMPEFADRLRLVETFPVLEADRFCATLIVTRSPMRDAL